MQINEDQLDEIPNVRRRGTFSKTDILKIVIVVTAVVGLVLYILKKPSTEKAEQKVAPKAQSAPLIGFVYPKEPKPLMPKVDDKAGSSLAPALMNMNTVKKVEWYDRKLFANKSNGSGGSAVGSSNVGTGPTEVKSEKTANSNETITFKNTHYQGSEAAMLPDPDYLLTRNTDIDCILLDALDTQHPGNVKCEVDHDVYSKSQNVILIDKGSFFMGEAQGGTNIRAGQSRIGVIWDRVDTPENVTVNLEGKAIDTLGRTGLEGFVDNHFPERFGASIAISLLQQGIQSASQVLSGNGGNNTYFGSGGFAGERLIESILQQQANQPPTIIANPGQKIKIRIRNDLSFKQVYKLKPKP